MEKLTLVALFLFIQTSGVKVDLMTPDGVAQLNGKWRYSNVRLVAALRCEATAEFVR
jgi:hypothetical protein